MDSSSDILYDIVCHSEKMLKCMTIEQDKLFCKSLIQKIKKYYKETPTALKCLDYLRNKYPFIMPTIDHTAYRFMSKDEWLQFDSQIDTSYICSGRLDFPLKSGEKYYKTAHWYNHHVYSRLFTSYITIDKTNEKLIKEITNSDLTIKQKYDKLKDIDQYVAWTAIWGDSINHIAIDLSLYPESFETIIEDMAKDLNLSMNKFNFQNPLIAVSQDGLLKQASTKSDLVDGIPKAYIEFVWRGYDKYGKIRDGFDTFNANGIFESTKPTL